MARPKWWRDPGKERWWRHTVRAWRQSGLSIRAFCARHGVAEHNFHAWRRELARRDKEVGRGALSGGAGGASGRASGGAAAAFLPVQVVAAEATEEATAQVLVALPSPIEIVLPAAVVRVPAGFDVLALQQILAVVANAQRVDAQRVDAEHLRGGSC